MLKILINLLIIAFLQANLTAGELSVNYKSSKMNDLEKNIYEFKSDQELYIKYIIEYQSSTNKVEHYTLVSNERSKLFKLEFSVSDLEEKVFEKFTGYNKLIVWELHFKNIKYSHDNRKIRMGYTNFSKESKIQIFTKNQKDIPEKLTLFKQVNQKDKRYLEIKVEFSKTKPKENRD